MPHTKSAKKSLRQNEKRRVRNKNVKKGLKVQLKNFSKATKAGGEELIKELRAAEQKLDKAAAKGVLHKNTVARKKSQLARQVNALAAK
ncbi:MAG: 30S ribosomal protein S20 [Zavarzinella sp.]